MKNRFFFIAFLVLALVFNHSCSSDKVEKGILDIDCSETISFQADIQQMIQQSCTTTGCHNEGAAAYDYILETHEQIAEHAEISLRTMLHEDDVFAMPPGGEKLPDESIEKFYCWIEQGKQDN